MTNAISITRTLRVENEVGLSGSEAQAVDGFDDIDVSIPAATNFPGQDAGMAGIKAMQLQSMSLLANQNDEALFLGPDYALSETTAVNAGVMAFLEFIGNLNEIIFPGDILLIEGTAADDGVYMVANEPGAYPARDITSVDFPGVVPANTDIFLANGHNIASVAVNAPGTFRKIMSVQHYNPKYDLALGTVNAGPPGNIVWPGDLTDQFEAGDYFIIDRGTDAPPGKDGIYKIDTIAYAAPDTTITLAAGLAFAEAANDGELHRVRLAFELQANNPILWSAKGGTNNPLQPDTPWTALQGDVDQLRIINTGTVAAAFSARLPRDVSLP